MDVGNTATNVIPAKATAVFDCRFNDRHTSADIEAWMRKRLDAAMATEVICRLVAGKCSLASSIGSVSKAESSATR